MKKFLFVVSLVAVVGLSVFAASCKKKKVTVTMSEPEIVIEINTAYQLSAHVENSTAAVTWSSSDASAVSVDGTGLITALASTKNDSPVIITAAVGKVSDTCAVSVYNTGEIARIAVPHTDINLYTGDAPLNLGARVVFKGADVSAPITYSSSDAAVVSVDSAGAVTALSEGSARIDISANHYGEITAQVNVRVLERSYIDLSESEIGLDVYAASGNKTAVITASVTDNGNAVGAPAVSWKIEQAEEIVTIAPSGASVTITAAAEGEASVIAEYTTNSGKKVSASVAVTTVFTAIPGAGLFDIFMSSGGSLSIPGEITAGFTKIADVTKGGNITVSANGTTMPAVSALTAGERTWRFYYADEAVDYRFDVITKVITNWDGLRDMMPDRTLAYSDQRPVVTGYYVLGQDVSLTGITGTALNAAAYAAGGHGVSVTGFNGIFDGRGFSITGGRYGAGGLFGTVLSGAVIRNIAVTAEYVDADFSGVFAHEFKGTLKNAYIKAAFAAGGSAYCGGIAGQINGAVLEDVVITIDSTSAGNARYTTIAPYIRTAVPTLTNVYTFSTTTACVSIFSNNGLPGAWTNTDYVAPAADLTKASFWADKNFSVGSLWEIDDDGIWFAGKMAAGFVAVDAGPADYDIRIDFGGVLSIPGGITAGFTRIEDVTNRTAIVISADGVAMPNVNTLTAGERTWRFFYASGNADKRIDVITQVITTAQQLVDLMPGRDAAYSAARALVTGYYQLGNDIDLSDVEAAQNSWLKATGYTPADSTDSETGFKGIFDGKGYKIKNGSYGIGGLFGTVLPGSIVRNVYFDSANLNGDSGGPFGMAVLAYDFMGTLKNVYMDVKSFTHYTRGIIARDIVSAVLENVVVNLTQHANSGAVGTLAYYFRGTSTYINVHTFTSNSYRQPFGATLSIGGGGSSPVTFGEAGDFTKASHWADKTFSAGSMFTKDVTGVLFNGIRISTFE